MIHCSKTSHRLIWTMDTLLSQRTTTIRTTASRQLSSLKGFQYDQLYLGGKSSSEQHTDSGHIIIESTLKCTARCMRHSALMCIVSQTVLTSVRDMPEQNHRAISVSVSRWSSRTEKESISTSRLLSVDGTWPVLAPDVAVACLINCQIIFAWGVDINKGHALSMWEGGVGGKHACMLLSDMRRVFGCSLLCSMCFD